MLPSDALTQGELSCVPQSALCDGRPLWAAPTLYASQCLDGPGRTALRGAARAAARWLHGAGYPAADAYRVWRDALLRRHLDMLSAWSDDAMTAALTGDPVSPTPQPVADALDAVGGYGLDGWGWGYQYWRTEDAAARGGGKHGDNTQYFSEPYMIHWLCNATLGAWWRRTHPDDAHEIPDAHPPDWAINGGVGRAWPDDPAALRVIDPCAGAGHFLAAAFRYLWEMGTATGEGMVQAARSILADSVCGLELDPDCAAVARIALTLNAWHTLGDIYDLPTPRVACCGAPAVTGWRGGDGDALGGMLADAPLLGSLVRPARAAPMGLLAGLFDPVAAMVAGGCDPVYAGIIGRSDYHLVLSNPPFLGSGEMPAALKATIRRDYPVGRNDLAAAMLVRFREFVGAGGVYAQVHPATWAFLGSYKPLRLQLLTEQTIHVHVKLGDHAFLDVSGGAVQVDLTIIENVLPAADHVTMHLNAA